MILKTNNSAGGASVLKKPIQMRNPIHESLNNNTTQGLRDFFHPGSTLEEAQDQEGAQEETSNPTQALALTIKSQSEVKVQEKLRVKAPRGIKTIRNLERVDNNGTMFYSMQQPVGDFRRQRPVFDKPEQRFTLFSQHNLSTQHVQAAKLRASFNKE